MFFTTKNTIFYWVFENPGPGGGGGGGGEQSPLPEMQIVYA